MYGPKNKKNKWIDPDPLSKGVLLSDRIKYYVDKIKLIVSRGV